MVNFRNDLPSLCSAGKFTTTSFHGERRVSDTQQLPSVIINDDDISCTSLEPVTTDYDQKDPRSRSGSGMSDGYFSAGATAVLSVNTAYSELE